MSITSELKEFACQVGFDEVGVTSAEDLGEAEAIVVERIRDGLFTGMDWLTVDRARLACRPRRVMPQARSILSLAVAYRPDASPTPSTSIEPRGRLACYAWGADYHSAMRDMLQQVVSFLERRTGQRVEARVFVDSGSLLERQVAFQSGIGWYGKSTNLLTKRFGSWVLLGEVLVDVELEADMPLATSCGRCDVCVRACPTGAISAPYVVDSRRCISFLTIELRGIIPHALRPPMGSWVFGCDICQEVCPVNARAQAGHHEFLRPHAGFDPGLFSLLGLSEAEYREKFRSSPVRRAKRRGLLRNVAVALGNLGDTAAVPALAAALEHREPLVRGHSAWALGRLDSKAARLVLEMARARETDEYVLMEIQGALAHD